MISLDLSGQATEEAGNSAWTGGMERDSHDPNLNHKNKQKPFQHNLTSGSGPNCRHVAVAPDELFQLGGPRDPAAQLGILAEGRDAPDAEPRLSCCSAWPPPREESDTLGVPLMMLSPTIPSSTNPSRKRQRKGLVSRFLLPP